MKTYIFISMFHVYKGTTCLQGPPIWQDELVEEYVWLSEAHGQKSVDKLHGGGESVRLNSTSAGLNEITGS